MNLELIPDTEDEYIGTAILTIMFFFMFVWLTSGASPINFPHRADYGVMISHLEVLLIMVIPIALLGLIESLYGHPQTQGTAIVQKYVAKVKVYRMSHSGKYGKYRKREESNA